MLQVVKIMRLIVMAGVALAGCASPASRTDTPPAPPRHPTEIAVFDAEGSLSNYIAAAAAGNPGLKAAFFRWKAATEKATQDGWLDDPSLTYEYFIQQVPTRQQIGLTQTIPGFGKRSLRAQRAGQEADAAWQELRTAARTMVRDVKAAYFDCYYLGRALAVTEENLQLMKSLEEVTLTRYETAAAGFTDVIKVQTERDKLKNELADLQDQRSVASARLAAQLGLPADATLPLPTQLTEAPAPTADWAALVSTNHPELESLQTLADAEATSARLARRSYFPDFMVGVNFMIMPAADGGNDYDQSLVAGITLPLWVGKYRAGACEAEARRQAYLLERDDKANGLGVDLKLAVYSFRDAERRNVLYRDSLIPKAEEALKVVRQEFSNGKADFAAVIEAQRSLLEFRLQQERARVDREKSLADIDRVAGKDADVLPVRE